MRYYMVRLGCGCPGHIGWGAEIEARHPRAAALAAVLGASTCSTCAEIHATATAGCSKWEWAAHRTEDGSVSPVIRRLTAAAHMAQVA